MTMVLPCLAGNLQPKHHINNNSLTCLKVDEDQLFVHTANLD